MSQVIILIRHAEKPGAGLPGAGVDEDGSEDAASLLIRGWQRAGGLAHLFEGSSPPFQRPNRIYASGVFKKDGSGSRSKRPLQTITPLARRIGVTPIDRLSKGQEAELAGELIGLDGITLVSWQHEFIPTIVRAIVGESFAFGWPDERFDLVWTLSRSPGAPDWSFSQAGQVLLAGDGAPPGP